MPIYPTPEGGFDVRVCVNYRRAHRRLPAGTTASGAKLVEAELRLSLKEARQPNGDPMLVELMATYSQHVAKNHASNSAKWHSLRIWRWIEGRRASETRSVVAKIVKDLTPVYAPATINRSLGALSKALSDGWQSGQCSQDWSSLVKRLPENNERTVTWTLEQVRKIADNASERVRVAIWTSLFTGCRRGEICKVRTADISPDRIRLLAGNTKTRKYREVPIAAAARPWVAKLPLGINFEGVKSGWQRARAKAGYPDAHFHDLRRSCGSLLIQAGVPLHQVSKILGHANTQITEKRYAFLLDSQLTESMDKAFGFAPGVAPVPEVTTLSA